MTFEPTPQQRNAIEAPLGPVLVVAGPGAGKTFCLIGRIRYLIEHHGILPGRICAVTFTNKAAQEIGARLKAALGPAQGEITGGTIHALCLRFCGSFPKRPVSGRGLVSPMRTISAACSAGWASR